jgi:hypothetical protein
MEPLDKALGIERPVLSNRRDIGHEGLPINLVRSPGVT